MTTAGAQYHGRKGRPWVRLQQRVIADAVRNHTPCPKCGQPIYPRGMWPDRHPLSPSADHKIPLSQAPHLAHTPTNLRAMHYGCNSSRQDARNESVNRRW